MALIEADRVLETTTTTGTGTLTLAGAVTGFRTFGSACANNDTCYYAAWVVDSVGNPAGDWETGLGTWATGGTLARTQVYASSNAGAAVNFPAGTKRVSISKIAGHGWRDITAEFTARTSGAAVPTLAAYNGTVIYQYQFSNVAAQELFVEFHLPHDYVPGTDVHIHVHWSQTTADPGTAVKWTFNALYAKGFDQEAFPAAVTTVSVTQNASSTVRRHMVAEVQLSTSGAINGNTLETDGVILVRVSRDPADAADTLTVAPFAHFCDLHYYSSNSATKSKAPNFYAP